MNPRTSTPLTADTQAKPTVSTRSPFNKIPRKPPFGELRSAPEILASCKLREDYSRDITIIVVKDRGESGGGSENLQVRTQN